jgi:hypothetical protein
MSKSCRRSSLSGTATQVGRISRSLIFALFAFWLLNVAWAQPKTPDVPTVQILSPAQGESEARTLLTRLLSQKPELSTTNTGQMRVRDGKGKQVEIPVRFEIACTETNWRSVYQTEPAPGVQGTAELVVIHSQGQPNVYRLKTGLEASSNTGAKALEGEQTMIPYAGSDFWVADLGLEFFHWPKQRVLRKEMRRGLYCDVLESADTRPGAGGYGRVVSWIDPDTGAIVHADAYDERNELLKQFDPTELKKVRGERQLEEMEMRNRKTGSHTWIKFELE